ncbi:EAL domain-containing protein [Alkalilimnicola sp. S0819]|uniref:bifunctional diguanylate cyclase/phosphodiesterase n=1 Tax=Alkalilimnicola sp. S0819 TaxID=2613922 RepID=UPI001261BE1A|nr:EAL domain-containing protein [Alkalilimnicola sp. S0819]KAB7622790.1 EAL domain-containing protein [Alkalilimnicola sp. S0819]MPQ17286.1 EAL domain-containing protein [Alkalilimnicola sp. S0819]
MPFKSNSESVSEAPWALWLPLLALPAALLIIWAVAFAVVKLQREEVIAVLEKEQQASLAVLASHAEGELRLYGRALQIAADALPVDDFEDPEALTAFLKAREPLRTLFDDALIVVSPDGRIIGSAPVTHAGQDVSQRLYFQEGQYAYEPFVARPFVAYRTGEPVIPVVVPRRDRRGDLRVLVVGGVNLARRNVLANLDTHSLGETGFFFLLTADGTVLSHPRWEPMSSPPQAWALAESVGPGGRNLIHEEVLYSLRPFNEGRWLLGVGFPLAEALAPVQDLRERVFAVGLVVSLLAMLLAFSAFRGISRLKRSEARYREFSRSLEVRVDERTLALKQSRERLSMAVQAGGVGLWDWDLEQDQVSLYRPERPDLPPRSMGALLDRVHPADQERVREIIQRYLDEPSSIYECEYRYRRENGSYAWALSRGRVFEWAADGSPRRMTGVVQDITQRKQAEQRIEYMAHYDALTELPNRVLFRDRVSQELAAGRREGRRFALFFIDLDQFKHVNDALGHQVGDELLRIVAGRLQACLREPDTLSRQGGDEFLLLAPDITSPGDAAVVAEKLLEAMREPVAVQGQELRVSGSVGIALYPDDGDTVDALIKHADLAMYQSKSAGRNAYHFFTACMDQQVEELVTLGSDLRSALSGDQFHLVYQPQVDSSSGRVIGAEALLRWEHPRRGPVSPGSFIPIAEDTGQILAVGEWVLRAAIRQLREWRRMGLADLPVAVNLSPRQFRQPDLAEQIGAMLDEAGVPAALLGLEITESALVEEAESTLEALHEMGCRLSVDDFGTGYSNLRYLKRFHIDKLKIDQCFVRDVPGDKEDEAVVEAVISLARSLGMGVVAEGVETARQLEFLLARECTEVQGFYYSRPRSAADFTTLLRGSRRLAGADVRQNQRTGTR